jgi:hypothetical protein
MYTEDVAAMVVLSSPSSYPKPPWPTGQAVALKLGCIHRLEG